MGLLNNDSAWSADPFGDSLKMQEEAAARGFDWPDARAVVEKLREEIEELDVVIRDGDVDAMRHEIGDLFLALINISRMLKFEPHDVMHRANERFRNRFVNMRALIESRGRSFDACSLRELDAAWNEIKRVDDAK